MVIFTQQLSCVCEHVVSWVHRICFLSILRVLSVFLILLPLISNTSVILLQGGSVMATGLVIAVTLHSMRRLPTLTSLVTLSWNIQYQNSASLTLYFLCNFLWNTVFNARNFLSVTIKLVILTSFALAFSTIWEGEDASLLSLLQVFLLRYLFGRKEIWVGGSLCVEVRREKSI